MYLWSLNLIIPIDFPDSMGSEKTLMSVFYENGYLINPNRFLFENKELKNKTEIIYMYYLYQAINKKNQYEQQYQFAKTINFKVAENRLNALKWLVSYKKNNSF